VAPKAAVVATADDARHERVLRAEGAEFVLNPYTLAAEQLAALIVKMHATENGHGQANGNGNGNGHHDTGGAPAGRGVSPDLAGVR
jgi:hypothetical protein